MPNTPYGWYGDEEPEQPDAYALSTAVSNFVWGVMVGFVTASVAWIAVLYKFWG